MAFCLATTAGAQVKKRDVPSAKQPSTAFACPMKCEGKKVYTKAGDCPVCGMHLTAVAKKHKAKKEKSPAGKQPS